MVLPCKFGRSCAREDCYFAHPDGRALFDGGGGGGPGAAAASLAAGLGTLRISPAAAQAGARACKFGFSCTRRDCFFGHPEGRAIDAAGAVQQPHLLHAGAAPLAPLAPAAATPGGSFNLPDSPFGVKEEAELEQMLEEQERQADKDTWFPARRDCACCRGYVHACVAPMCVQLGICGCTLEDADVQAAGDED